METAAFEAFAPRVNVRWNDRFLFVESNGLPPHNMMVGITAWQQQVPLPQNYTGATSPQSRKICILQRKRTERDVNLIVRLLCGWRGGWMGH